MEHIFEILYECEKMDLISVDDLSYAKYMLLNIGVPIRADKQENIDCLEQMYQYWGLHSYEDDL